MTRALPLAALPLAALVLFTGCAPLEAPAPPEAAPGVTASRCGACHSEQHEAWSSSRHGNSGSSPIFAAMLPVVAERCGTWARDRCVACHQPGHTTDAVVTCISCHAATGNRGGDGSVILQEGLIVGSPGAATDGPHAVRESELLAAPDLCGSCHELTGPGLFVEPTHSEYRASWAAEDGVSCADCHMPDREPGPVAEGSTNVRPRRDHSFIGFDPPWGADADEAERAANATRSLLASALELELRLVGDALEVRLTNRGAGHNVPTGASWMRDLWVDVELEADDGERWTEARVLELGARPIRGEREVPLAMGADRIVDLTLAPDETLVGRVELGDAIGAVARLRGRALREQILSALGLEELAGELPTHEVHEVLWQR